MFLPSHLAFDRGSAPAQSNDLIQQGVADESVVDKTEEEEEEEEGLYLRIEHASKEEEEARRRRRIAFCAMKKRERLHTKEDERAGVIWGSHSICQGTTTSCRKIPPRGWLPAPPKILSTRRWASLPQTCV